MKKLKDYELIISDVDGVLIREGEPIYENLQVMSKLRSMGKEVVLISNNSGINRVLLSRLLTSFGLPIEPERIITSAVATAHYLKTRTEVRNVFVVGEEGLINELRNNQFTIIDEKQALERGAEAVVVGLDRFATYEKLSLAARIIKNGAMFIATNADRLWPSKAGLKLGAGALVQAIVFGIKKEPDVITGKPHKWILVPLSSDIKVGKTVIIGDQLETDIRLANTLGVDSILVLTGVSSKDELTNSSDDPTIVTNTLLDLEIE
ncbi:haloacid dehalogenase [Sulfolobales archaeon HS-7]|nr:haloacid dehalogenase [Sulfolobales archaeon HS-7]